MRSASEANSHHTSPERAPFHKHLTSTLPSRLLSPTQVTIRVFVLSPGANAATPTRGNPNYAGSITWLQVRHLLLPVAAAAGTVIAQPGPVHVCCAAENCLVALSWHGTTRLQLPEQGGMPGLVAMPHAALPPSCGWLMLTGRRLAPRLRCHLPSAYLPCPTVNRSLGWR